MVGVMLKREYIKRRHLDNMPWLDADPSSEYKVSGG